MEDKEKFLIMFKQLWDDFYSKYRNLSMQAFDNYLRNEAERVEKKRNTIKS